jgi:hypothetical protein
MSARLVHKKGVVEIIDCLFPRELAQQQNEISKQVSLSMQHQDVATFQADDNRQIGFQVRDRQSVILETPGIGLRVYAIFSQFTRNQATPMVEARGSSAGIREEDKFDFGFTFVHQNRESSLHIRR